MNKVLIVGKLTKDPDLKYSQSGVGIARFTVAVNRPFKNKSTDSYEADFPSCIAFGKTAEFVANYFKKGQSIAIEGRIQTGSYDKDGEKRYTTDIAVEHVEFVGSKKDNAKQDNGSTGGLGEEVVFSDDDLPFN